MLLNCFTYGPSLKFVKGFANLSIWTMEHRVFIVFYARLRNYMPVGKPLASGMCNMVLTCVCSGVSGGI
jgi:hypothetical protein